MVEQFLTEAMMVAVADDLRSGYSDNVDRRIADVLERIVQLAHALEAADAEHAQALYQDVWGMGQD